MLSVIYLPRCGTLAGLDIHQGQCNMMQFFTAVNPPSQQKSTLGACYCCACIIFTGHAVRHSIIAICTCAITASCSQRVLYFVWLHFKATSKTVTQREAGAASVLHVYLPFSSNTMKGETFSIWQIVM